MVYEIGAVARCRSKHARSAGENALVSGCCSPGSTSSPRPTSPRRFVTRPPGSAIPSAAARIGSRISPRACACCPTARASWVASGTRPAARSGSTRTAGRSGSSSTLTCAAARQSPRMRDLSLLCTHVRARGSAGGRRGRGAPGCADLFVRRLSLHARRQGRAVPGRQDAFPNMVVFREAPDNHDLIARGLASRRQASLRRRYARQIAFASSTSRRWPQCVISPPRCPNGWRSTDRETSGPSSTAARPCSRSRPQGKAREVSVPLPETSVATSLELRPRRPSDRHG